MASRLHTSPRTKEVVEMVVGAMVVEMAVGMAVEMVVEMVVEAVESGTGREERRHTHTHAHAHTNHIALSISLVRYWSTLQQSHTHFSPAQRHLDSNRRVQYTWIKLSTHDQSNNDYN